MTGYEVFLALHIGGAIIWIGAGFLISIFATRARLAPDPARVVALAHDAEWLGLRLFLPSNLLVLATGFLLVERGDWGYGPLWITLALVGFIVSFATGGAFFGPGWQRVGKIAEAEGNDSPSIRASVRRLLIGGWSDVGLLFAVVFVMAVKPSGDDAGALAVTGAIWFVFALLGIALARRERPRPA